MKSSAFLCVLCASAFLSFGQTTPVLLPVNSLFGGAAYNKPITITAANTLITDGQNLWAGTYTILPESITNIVVGLYPNTYLVQITGVTKPARFSIYASDGTNVVNVASRITYGPLYYFGTNGLSQFIQLVGGPGIVVTNVGGTNTASISSAVVTNTQSGVSLGGIFNGLTTNLYFSTSPSQLTNTFQITNAEYAFANLPVTFYPGGCTNGMLVWTNTGGNGLPVFLVWNDPDWTQPLPHWTIQTNLPDVNQDALYELLNSFNLTNLVGGSGWWDINPNNSSPVSPMSVLAMDYAVQFNDAISATNISAANASLNSVQANTISAQVATLNSANGTFTGTANLTGGNVVTNLAMPAYNLTMFPFSGVTNVVWMYTSSCPTNFAGGNTVVFTDNQAGTSNNTVRDPSHFLYTDNNGKSTWILTWSHYANVGTNRAFGMATNSADSSFVFKAYVPITNSIEAVWSPKLFTDGTNGLHVVMIIDGDLAPLNTHLSIADIDPVKFTLSNQRNLSSITTFEPNGTSIYYINGTFFLFGTGEYCNTTLSPNGWTLLPNLLGSPQASLNSPTLTTYLGQYFLINTYSTAFEWASYDLTNWTAVPAWTFPNLSVAEGDGTIQLIPVPPSGINIGATGVLGGNGGGLTNTTVNLATNIASPFAPKAGVGQVFVGGPGGTNVYLVMQTAAGLNITNKVALNGQYP